MWVIKIELVTFTPCGNFSYDGGDDDDVEKEWMYKKVNEGLKITN